MGRGLHPAAIAATSDEARRSRPLAVRLIIAFPNLARRFGVAIVTSPLSPIKRVFVRVWARLIFDAYTRRDWEMNTLALDPSDYELSVGDPGLLLPGLRETYTGIDGYIEAQLAIIEVFRDLEVVTESVGLAGPRRLVAMLRWRGTAAGSGISIDQPMMTVGEFPNGLVSRQSYWIDREAGLRKLGLTAPRR